MMFVEFLSLFLSFFPEAFMILIVIAILGFALVVLFKLIKLILDAIPFL